MLLKDKVAIVTGGTRGIGYAIAEKYLENGAKVVIFGSRTETVEKAVNSLKEKNADWEISGDCPNLKDADAVAAAVNKVIEKYGRLDILANNAGVSDSTPIDNYTAEMFDSVIGINLNAIMYAVMPAVKQMKEQKSGVIINTSSMVSICGQTSGLAYPTSKAAVNGLTWSLAREVAPYGIRVNAVAPGIIKTDMVANLPEEMIQPLINAIPMRRMGEAEDIANAFVYLASDLASYVTGEVLSVDGAMRV
ncbi:MAG: SDR family oxidoreductase [Lachnospiraceae bacterium]|nr:SDR family oxidoreductase [Candidatus Equihabitans merdae]